MWTHATRSRFPFPPPIHSSAFPSPLSLSLSFSLSLSLSLSLPLVLSQALLSLSLSVSLLPPSFSLLSSLHHAPFLIYPSSLSFSPSLLPLSPRPHNISCLVACIAIVTSIVITRDGRCPLSLTRHCFTVHCPHPHAAIPGSACKDPERQAYVGSRGLWCRARLCTI